MLTPRRWLRIIPVLVLIGALVSACGPLGDDDGDPTPTAPAVPGADSPTTEAGDASPAATPASTPRAAAGAGTPRAAPPPTADAEDESEPAGTPDDAAEVDDADATEAAVDAPAATDDEDTPVAEDDEPEATEGPEPTTVVVADCEEPDVLPERTGRQNRIVAEDELNLRSGPGTSCDAITSLAIDTPVRVVSGVVEAEGDDNEWVKIEVDDTEGWVAVDFLANPPEE